MSYFASPIFLLACGGLLTSCVYIPPPDYALPPRPIYIEPPLIDEQAGYHSSGYSDYDVEIRRQPWDQRDNRHKRELRRQQRAERGRQNYSVDRYYQNQLREEERDESSNDNSVQRDSAPSIEQKLPETTTKSTQSQSATAKPKAEIPFGKRTNLPNRVKSPYPPHNELDVEGMDSGALARDPTTGKVFRIP